MLLFRFPVRLRFEPFFAISPRLSLRFKDIFPSSAASSSPNAPRALPREGLYRIRELPSVSVRPIVPLLCEMESDELGPGPP